MCLWIPALSQQENVLVMLKHPTPAYQPQPQESSLFSDEMKCVWRRLAQGSCSVWKCFVYLTWELCSYTATWGTSILLTEAPRKLINFTIISDSGSGLDRNTSLKALTQENYVQSGLRSYTPATSKMSAFGDKWPPATNKSEDSSGFW